MSRKSTIKRTLPRKEKKSEGPVPEQVVETEEPVIEEEQLLMDKVRPHVGTILLVGIAAVLSVMAIQFWRSANFQTEAIKWVELSQAKSINAASGEVKELNRVADEFPDSRVGLISAMYAADSQLRTGIYQLGRDREGGLGLVKKARDNLKSVVDADARLKTPWLSQRAQFTYAYACETLGEFDKAKTGYQDIVDNAPDSPLADRSKRGLARVTNDQYIAMYKKFKDYEAEMGDAPGPLGSEGARPGIGLNDFQGMDIEPGKKPPAQSPLDPKAEDPDAKSGDDSETTTDADMPADEEKKAPSPPEAKAPEDKGSQPEEGQSTEGKGEVDQKTGNVPEKPEAEKVEPKKESTEPAKDEKPSTEGESSKETSKEDAKPKKEAEPSEKPETESGG